MSWELALTPKSEVAILCPVRGSVPYVWAMNAVNLEIPVNWAWHASSGMPIDVSRDHLVELALKDGAEHLFFWDTDVLIPPYTLQRFMGLHLPIISGLYFAKSRLPCVYKQLADGEIKPYTQEELEGLVFPQVYAVGAGCLFVDAKVFKQLPKPWFKWTLDPDAPKELQKLQHSEDIYFCIKAQEHGFPIYLDGSIRCKHVLETEYAIDEKGEFTPVI